MLHNISPFDLFLLLTAVREYPHPEVLPARKMPMVKVDKRCDRKKPNGKNE